MATVIAFWVLAILSVVASIAMVVTKNPVRSALALVGTFICVAAFYVLLSAQFIAAVQVIVYAGAIMVLFLFVIMLLNLGSPGALRERGSLQPIIATGLGICFLIALLLSGSLLSLPLPAGVRPAEYEPLGTVRAIGINLYDPNQPWLFPFEATSILLLVAVIGAIIMAKRKV